MAIMQLIHKIVKKSNFWRGYDSKVALENPEGVS